MHVLEGIPLRGGLRGRIELCPGDLTNLSPVERADVLLVSAFPDGCEPSVSEWTEAIRRSTGWAKK